MAIVSGKGAVNPTGASTAGSGRLFKVGKTVVAVAGTQFPTAGTGAQSLQNINVYGTSAVAPADIISPTNNPQKGFTGVTNPKNYKFNLPPHLWSLPIRPINIGTREETFVKNTTYESFHGLRRGRLWFYLGEYDLSKTNQGSVVTTGTGSRNTSSSQTNSNSSLQGLKSSPGATEAAQYKPQTGSRNYGFQFLWNPESISSSVSINMDVTPTSTDRFRSVSGVFLGSTVVSINVVLDRTNDFACFKGDYRFAIADTPTGKRNSIQTPEYWAKYYKATYPQEDKSVAISTRIYELMDKGTLADLEYLFKAINGSGAEGSKDWSNLLGRKTADIGFLQPVLLGMQLGPTVDSLSYVGWITSLSVNHVAFTESMIPIRSIVTINMQTMTGTGLANAK
jgi:hypothetical protein